MCSERSNSITDGELPIQPKDIRQYIYYIIKWFALNKIQLRSKNIKKSKPMRTNTIRRTAESCRKFFVILIEGRVYLYVVNEATPLQMVNCL